MKNSKLVFSITSYIPEGKILTYGSLAKLVNLHPRAVGTTLHSNKDPKNIPCHRVVNSLGKVAKNYRFGGGKSQLIRLEKEGVDLSDFQKYLWTPSKPLSTYFELLSDYGEPGLWPWFANGDPHPPEEIAIGAILTQNTNWNNVEKALVNLRRENLNKLKEIYNLRFINEERLKEQIKPSGFYNQKSESLLNFCNYIVSNFKSLDNFLKLPMIEAREKLLSLKGVGKETADAILLYSGHQPIFVIDKYTQRFAQKLDLTKDLTYDNLQRFFMANLPKDVKLYQNYHALIVRWAQDKVKP